MSYIKSSASQLSKQASGWNIDRTAGKILRGTFGAHEGEGYSNGGGGYSNGNNNNTSIPEPDPSPDPEADPTTSAGGGSDGNSSTTDSGTLIASNAPNPAPTVPPTPPPQDDEDETANVPQQVSGAFLTGSTSPRTAGRRDLWRTVNRSMKSLSRAGQNVDHRRPVR